MCLAVKIMLPEIMVYTQVTMATCSNSTVTNFNGLYICTYCSYYQQIHVDVLITIYHVMHLHMCAHTHTTRTLASVDYA